MSQKKNVGKGGKKTNMGWGRERVDAEVRTGKHFTATKKKKKLHTHTHIMLHIPRVIHFHFTFSHFVAEKKNPA